MLHNRVKLHLILTRFPALIFFFLLCGEETFTLLHRRVETSSGFSLLSEIIHQFPQRPYIKPPSSLNAASEKCLEKWCNSSHHCCCFWLWLWLESWHWWWWRVIWGWMIWSREGMTPCVRVESECTIFHLKILRFFTFACMKMPLRHVNKSSAINRDWQQNTQKFLVLLFFIWPWWHVVVHLLSNIVVLAVFRRVKQPNMKHGKEEELIIELFSAMKMM